MKALPRTRRFGLENGPKRLVDQLFLTRIGDMPEKTPGGERGCFWPEARETEMKTTDARFQINAKGFRMRDETVVYDNKWIHGSEWIGKMP